MLLPTPNEAFYAVDGGVVVSALGLNLSLKGCPLPLFQCSTLFQRCSSALEHGFPCVFIGRTASFFFFVPDK